MTDIVERLLSRPDDINPVLKQDAAAEIKRLRDALQGLIDFVEIDNLRMDPIALSIARSALAVPSEEHS